MDRGHAEALMPAVARVMAQVEGGFAALDRVAVTVGPGSFTGIRIGVAAARGIALACGIEAVGVSTLAAFAAPLLFDEVDSIVVSAIDARHDHVFFTAYGPGGRVLTSPRILPCGMRAVCSGPAASGRSETERISCAPRRPDGRRDFGRQRRAVAGYRRRRAFGPRRRSSQRARASALSQGAGRQARGDKALPRALA